MDQAQDNAFIRKFSGILIGLLVLTIVLIFVARSLQTESGVDDNPSQKIIAEQRIKPVSSVHMGDEVTSAPTEASASTSPTPPTVAVVEVDGEAVYNGLCMTCHEAGIAGAPVTDSDQMAERLSEKGIDTLVMNVINGLNVMPPRGGNPSLTDDQIQAAVEFMLP